VIVVPPSPYQVTFPSYQDHQSVRVFPLMEKTAWLGALLAGVAVALDPLLLGPAHDWGWTMALHGVGAVLAVVAALVARLSGRVRPRLIVLLVLVNVMQAVMASSVLFLQHTAGPLPGLLVFYFFCLLPLASLTSPALLVAVDGALLIQTLVLMALAEASGSLGPPPYVTTLQFLIPGQILFSLYVVWTRQQALESYLLARDDHVHLTLDSLSEVLNRATWLRRAESRLGRDHDAGRPSVLIMADIDHFKTINDSWGHPAGDEVIRAVARVLVETTRDDDLVGRFGGEEFAVFLPDTDLATGLQVAERIRGRVEAQNLFCPVTLSLGAAMCGPGVSGLGDLIQEADRQLYAAKRAGRNQVRPPAGPTEASVR